MQTSHKFLRSMSAALVVAAVATVMPTKGLFFSDAQACGVSSSVNTAEAAVAVGVLTTSLGASAGFFGLPGKKGKPEAKKPGDASISPFVGDNGAPVIPGNLAK